MSGPTGTVASTVASTSVPGAPLSARTSSMPAAPRTTSTVTTTVKAIVSRRFPGMSEA